MALDKLYSGCEKCSGSGTWTRPAEQRGNSRVMYGAIECPDCDGVGKIPTPDGAHILDLINVWRSKGRLR